jgi:hypothetical protein
MCVSTKLKRMKTCVFDTGKKEDGNFVLEKDKRKGEERSTFSISSC